MDTFLKSQTFKTGMFVLLVLFVLLIIFKLGVVHGYKKAHFSQIYGAKYHHMVPGKFFGHQRGAFNKGAFGDFSYKKRLIKVEAVSDSTVGNESGAVDFDEEEI